MGGEDCRLGERERPVDGEGSRNVLGGVEGGCGMEGVLVEVGGDGWEGAGIRSGLTSDAAGPAAGFLPSLKALAMSAAFHLAYLIFPSVYTRVSMMARVEHKTTYCF